MESYRNGVMYLDHVSLEMLAEQYGTPLYVYSKRKIEKNVRMIQQGLQSSQHLMCFPLRANQSLGILSIFKQLGTGFVVGTVEELRKVLKLGADPQKITVSGVGKTKELISQAIANNVYCIHAESWQELERIEQLGREGNKVVPVGVRINPEVDAHVHPNLATALPGSRYGFPLREAESACMRVFASRSMELLGVKYHLGSQVLVFEPFLEALEKIMDVVDKLDSKGVTMKHVDVGGGIGVPRRHTDDVPGLDSWIRRIAEPIERRGLRVVCEPGRCVILDAGLLLTRVEYIKKAAGRNYLIVDASLSELVTPALYDSYHEIRSVSEGVGQRPQRYDVVGPGTGPAETFGVARYLPMMEQGALLAILTTGAYGSCLSSNFASRNLVMEIVVDGPAYAIIRERQTLEQQVANERFFKD
ncbi:diaminopimelate decarboxylase-like [Haemaphysalis longicornis]